MKLLLLILATLVFGFHFETAKGQERFGIDIVEADPGMDKVEIYLHTVNIGNKIYDNFGHTAIRVVDKRTYTDLVYNWGMFDFGNPLSFSLDFYRGDLNYKLGVYSMDTALRVYQSDTRSVWEDRLILTPIRKNRLLNLLASWTPLEEGLPEVEDLPLQQRDEL